MHHKFVCLANVEVADFAMMGILAISSCSFEPILVHLSLRPTAGSETHKAGSQLRPARLPVRPFLFLVLYPSSVVYVCSLVVLSMYVDICLGEARLIHEGHHAHVVSAVAQQLHLQDAHVLKQLHIIE